MQVKRQPQQVDSSAVKLPLSDGRFFYISKCSLEKIARHYWRAIRSCNVEYIGARMSIQGRKKLVKLHRFLMSTPPGYECHHKDFNPFNNTLENLENLTPSEHRIKHGKSR